MEELRAFILVRLRLMDEPIPRALGNRATTSGAGEGGGAPAEAAGLKRRMGELKRSPEVTLGLLGMVGFAPTAVERRVVEVLGARGTLIMTNVPGPRHAVYLAGTRLAGLMFWVPQAAKLGLGVSIFSYAGQVTAGVSVDAGLVPDTHRLVRAF